jgi:hypothetical protein
VRAMFTRMLCWRERNFLIVTQDTQTRCSLQFYSLGDRLHIKGLVS